MKQFYFFALLLSVQFATAQIVAIPDINFKTGLLNQIPAIDINGDGEIQLTEAQNYTGIIDVSSLDITDLTGIESFISVTGLACSNNSISSIDLTNNVALQKIDCAANSINELVISQNLNLLELVCNGNDLVELNTSFNFNLELLNVAANNIISLDLSTNVALKDLRINFNPIQTIDISNNINLEGFTATYCYELEDVDFSNNNMLESILLWYSIQSSIDVSNMPNLSLLYLRALNLGSLDVSNNPGLFNLYVTDNNIYEIDVSNNTNLAYLSIDNLYIQDIDVSNNPNLVWLDLKGNQIQTVNAKNGNNTIFTNFQISNANSLSSICVDDVAFANANFTKPSNSYFTEICSADDCELTEVGYTQGFENIPEPFIDPCWTAFPANSSSSYYHVKTIGYGYTGSNSVRLRSNGSGEAYLISPELEGFDSSKRISFWLSSGEINNLEIGIITDPNDFSTYEFYKSLNILDGNGPAWRNFKIDFADYTGSAKYVVFKIDGYGLATLDDFSYENSPPCTEAYDLSAIRFSSEVILDWNDYGSPMNWDIEYGLAGFEQGTGTVINTTSKPFILDQLDSSTTYDFYVKSNCDAGEFSDWSFNKNFTTLCEAKLVGYNYGFDDDYPLDFDTCWNNFGSVNTNTGGNSPDSQRLLQLQTYNYINIVSTVVTPELADLSNDKRIKFWVNSFDGLSGLVIGTMQNQNDESTFTAFQTIDASQFPVDEWVPVNINFDTYSGNDRFIAIRQDFSGDESRIYIDDFSYQIIPSCLEPSTFEATSVLDTQVDFQWTELGSASNWEIEYGMTGFNPGEGIIVPTNVTTTTIDNLITDTTYDFYLRAVCSGNENSEWVPIYELTTACGPITANYTQNFDAPQMANCWTTIPAVATGGTNAEEVTTSTQYQVFGSGYSARFADYTFENDLYLITPELSDLGSSSNRIKFWLHPRYSDAHLIIGTMSNPADEATFTAYTTILNTDMVYREWKQFTINFDDYSGTDHYVAFKMELVGEASNIYEFLYLDQFAYSAIPSCQTPTEFSNDMVSNGDITLSWLDSNNATQWEIEYGETGFWQGQGTIVQTNTNPFVLTSLPLETSYDIYVRSICSNGDYSDWTEKLVVDLGCGESYIVGYMHDFDTATLDDCWIGFEYPNNSSSTSFLISNSIYNGDSGYSAYLSDTSYFNSNVTLMVSPIFTDMTTDKKIEFYISDYSGGLQVGTMSDPNDGSTFELLESISGNVASLNWEKRTVYLTNYNGTDAHLAFRQKRSSSTGTKVYIDDFSYLQSVVCDMPTDFTIVSTADNTVELSWTGSGVESQWELELEQVGVNNSEINILVSSENYILENLLEGTEYTVKLRAKCDDESLFSEWIDTLSFTTSCMPVSANYFESFEFENVLSPCWTKLIQSDTSTANVIVTGDVSVNYSSTWVGGILYEILPVTGNQFVRFSNFYDTASSDPSEMILISRSIADLDANKRIKFHLISRKVTSGSSTYNLSNLYIGTMSDPNDASTFSLIHTITPEEMNEFKTDGLPVVDWKEHTVYLNDYVGTDNYIAIMHDDQFFGTEFYIDDFKYEIKPDCTEPLYPTVIDERYNEVDIAWDSYENTNAIEWEVQYGFSDFSLGDGLVISSATEQTTLSSLVDNTDYDFYVRSNCGNGYSEWSVKQRFTTKCEGFEVGYFENFDSQNEGRVQSCWTAIRPTGTGASYWDESYNNLVVVDDIAPNAFTAHSGPNCVRHFNETSHPYGNEVSDQIVLVSPRLIDLDNYKKVSFWVNATYSVYSSASEIIIGTLSDPDDYTTFTPYYTITNAYENLNTWTQYEIDLSDYYLTDEYIGIKQSAINERQEILIDDFEYSENGCVTPTALTAMQSGDDEIILSWQDNNSQNAPESWEIEYGHIGFVQGSGTVVQASTNPFTLTINSILNQYEFYARAYCNTTDGYSNWSNPYAFTVTCAVSAPFNEDFDQYDATYQGTTTGIPGFCWTAQDHNTAGIVDVSNYEVSTSSWPNVGRVSYPSNIVTNYPPGLLVSPYLSDFDSNKVLKIWVRNEFNGFAYSPSGIIIGTMTNPLDDTTFVPFDTIESEEIPIYGREFLIDFAAYIGDAHHIAILHDQNNTSSVVYFDDIYYLDRPDCLEPIDVDFSEISDTSVTVVWEDYDSQDNFEVQYGLEGFTIGTGITSSVTGISTIINNLNPETTYDIYVRTDCGNGSYSEWIGPKKANTACDIEALPWTENFDNMSQYGQGILPECFNGDPAWVSSNINLSQYQQGDGDTDYLYVIYDDYGLKTSLTTPMFQLEMGTTYTLAFKIRKEQGDYSSQSVKIWTGKGNSPELLTNYINYFSEFSFGFYEYYTIETTFTPVESGSYSFYLDFGFSSIVHTITIDSFSLNGDYNAPIVISENSSVEFDFNGTLPAAFILEETENSLCGVINDDGEFVIRMTGNNDSDAWFNAGNDALNWIENQGSISKVNLEIDATNVSELFMNFDLKQTFENFSNESLFRVVANGNILQTFVPNGNEIYQTKEINLSSFAGNNIRISLQHLGRFRGDGSTSGDKAYLDNLRFGEESTLNVTEQDFSQFNYYPNPVTHHFHIENAKVMNQINVIDMLGRTIRTFSIHDINASLDLSQLPSGVYFVVIKTEMSTKTIKIFKR